MALDLDVLDQELGVGSWVKDTVLNRRGNVDSESLGGLLLSRGLLEKF